MELAFIFAAVYVPYILYIIVVSLLQIARGEKKPGVLLGIAEVIFTVIGPAIGFWRFDQYGHDIPFAKPEAISIMLLTATSSAAFWLAKLTEPTNNPVVRIIISAGMLQVMLVCVLTSIHFITFIPLGIMFPWAGFELLSPLLAFFLLFREFYFYNRRVLDMEELLPYHKELGFVPLPHQVFQLPLSQRLVVYTALAVIAIVLQSGLLYAIGQPIDTVIRAYTHSTGFIFSMYN